MVFYKLYCFVGGFVSEINYVKLIFATDCNKFFVQQYLYIGHRRETKSVQKSGSIC